MSVTLLPRLLRLNILGWTVVESVIQLSHSLWFCVTMLVRYRWWVSRVALLTQRSRQSPRMDFREVLLFSLNIHLFIYSTLYCRGFVSLTSTIGCVSKFKPESWNKYAVTVSRWKGVSVFMGSLFPWRLKVSVIAYRYWTLWKMVLKLG